MSFKYFIPKIINNVWKSYWSNVDVEKEVRKCSDDELWSLIKKYVKKEDKILDAGCGLGRWVIFLSKKGYQIIGVDNYKEAISRLKKADSFLSLKVADVCKLPFKNEEFDVYLSFGVVEHFENGPTKALREANRVLKRGGLIILETPHDNLLRRFKRFCGRFKRFFKKQKVTIPLQFYEYRYKTSELKNFLGNAGFKIVGSYAKDLLSDDESIGLWSDFLFLRKSKEPFKINQKGKLIKKILKPFKFVFAGCTVVVAQKL